MRYPAFFDQVRPIVLYDPLAEFLGAAADGRIEYRYLGAVKLAGHSCPTVAGAYLMTLKALAALYPGTTPEHGATGLSAAEQREFGDEWQARVGRILIDAADSPALVAVTTAGASQPRV